MCKLKYPFRSPRSRRWCTGHEESTRSKPCSRSVFRASPISTNTCTPPSMDVSASSVSWTCCIGSYVAEIIPRASHEYSASIPIAGMNTSGRFPAVVTTSAHPVRRSRLSQALPHTQWVFTFPSSTRSYCRHNRRLFSESSRLIFSVIEHFYTKVAKRPIKTGMVLARNRKTGDCT